MGFVDDKKNIDQHRSVFYQQLKPLVLYWRCFNTNTNPSSPHLGISRATNATQTTWTAGCTTFPSETQVCLWTAPCRAARASRATCRLSSGEEEIWKLKMNVQHSVPDRVTGAAVNSFPVTFQGRRAEQQSGAHRSERPRVTVPWD